MPTTGRPGPARPSCRSSIRRVSRLVRAARRGPAWDVTSLG
jgi:hypothetical protein